MASSNSPSPTLSSLPDEVLLRICRFAGPGGMRTKESATVSDSSVLRLKIPGAPAHQARQRPSIWRRFFHPRQSTPAPDYLPAAVTQTPLAHLERRVKNALWNLCLVSHRVHGPASEILYGNVTLSSSTIRKFMFTISASQIHAELVRHLRYAYSTSRNAPGQTLQGPSWLSDAQIRRKMQTFALIRGLPRLIHEQVGSDSIIDQTLIVLSLPKLLSLHAIVRVSAAAVANGYAPIRFLSWVGSASMSNSPGHMTSYEKLQSITLVSESVRQPQANIGAVARVFKLPMLRTLRLKYFASEPYPDGSITLDSFINGDEEAPRTIVNLSLGGCELSKEDIIAISRRVAPLYSFHRNGVAHYAIHQDQSAKAYMAAFKSSRKSLESLSLDLGTAQVQNRRSPVVSAVASAKISELHGPVDLTQFVALKHLTLTISPFTAVDETRVTKQQLSSSMLPAQLETLHLEVVRSYCGYKVEYPAEGLHFDVPMLDAVIDFLFADLRNLSSELPLLRQAIVTIDVPENLDMQLLRGLLFSLSGQSTCQLRLFIRHSVDYDAEMRGMVENLTEVKQLPVVDSVAEVEEEQDGGEDTADLAQADDAANVGEPRHRRLLKLKKSFRKLVFRK